MEDYLLIAFGVACIVFRKSNMALKNRIDKKMFGWLRAKIERKSFESADEKTLANINEKTLDEVEGGALKMQDVFAIVGGLLFILFGILKRLGVIHMRQ